MSPLVDVLRQVKAPGQIAAGVDVAAMGLSFQVQGVGKFRPSLSAEDVARLVEVASPSAFGHRDQTRMDPTVRSSCEIRADAIQLSSGWARRLDRALQQLRAPLGLAPDVEVRATFQKLVLYGPGDHFQPHRDTQRDPSMWGTLVAVLPVAHEGGAFTVQHAGQQVAFETGDLADQRRLGFVALYADCVHQVQPVTGGARVALTFSLHGPVQVRPYSADGPRAQVARAVQEHFQSEEMLVLLLDHAYTRQRFAWDALHGADRLRVDLLRQAAPDCAAFLTFAEVLEEFEYEGEGHATSRDDFGFSRGLQADLSDWRDERDQPCAGTDFADDGCLVSLVPSMDRRPTKVAGEPWTGNEGGSAAQWYHQAAVVLVPRDGDLFEQITG